MIQDNVGGLPVDRTDTMAANEEFTGIVSRRDAVRRPNGWDPYEVWATRVKERRRKPRAPGTARDPRR